MTKRLSVAVRTSDDNEKLEQSFVSVINMFQHGRGGMEDEHCVGNDECRQQGSV